MVVREPACMRAKGKLDTAMAGRPPRECQDRTEDWAARVAMLGQTPRDTAREETGRDNRRTVGWGRGGCGWDTLLPERLNRRNPRKRRMVAEGGTEKA